jgi:uncharacterized protein YwgA
MNAMKESVLIGGIVHGLNERHSWSGETHIQKTSYVAKDVLKVPFESEFVLYKHGPYSFDLNSSLMKMRAQNLLAAIPQGQYGSTYQLNEPLWNAIKASSEVYDRFRTKLDFVCGQMARKNVAQLERLVTAVFVILRFPKLNPQHMRAKLREMKPHISEADAAIAFTEATDLMEQSKNIV